ncbi:hypothetical protein [Sporosarcina psychrophila]|uniref:hypothetical protein n=1 Tax=Sporosarcina psychrophila TaxID=1476 RepID=UPI00078C6F08|nr:hypothetical protein [Sporosarcina psychrophila]AMQ05899.1 hypothetical protein AZE41_08200 [Sporosarcina psychrophila]
MSDNNFDFNSAVRNMNASLNRDMKLISDLNSLKRIRESEQHEALLRIADNTEGIQELVTLVRQGNEINQEAFALLQEIQTIMTAPTREEGESILRRVLNKATQANEDLDTIQTLLSHGKMLIGAIFPDSGA